MSLSCSCGEWDGEGWYFISPNDYSTLTTNHRKRCCSCQSLIDRDSIVTCFNRYRGPKDDIEERIYGDDGEIGMSSWYMCEVCSDLFFSLDDLGFCINLGDSMHELVGEYHDGYS